MTKGELIKALEPFSDEIEILKPVKSYDSIDGDGVVNEPITRLTYFYVGVDDGGQIILE